MDNQEWATCAPLVLEWFYWPVVLPFSLVIHQHWDDIMLTLSHLLVIMSDYTEPSKKSVSHREGQLVSKDTRIPGVIILWIIWIRCPWAKVPLDHDFHFAWEFPIDRTHYAGHWLFAYCHDLADFYHHYEQLYSPKVYFSQIQLGILEKSCSFYPFTVTSVVKLRETRKSCTLRFKVFYPEYNGRQWQACSFMCSKSDFTGKESKV